LLSDKHTKTPNLYQFDLTITDHIIDEYGDDAATEEQRIKDA
jgi:hypothetical protein